MISWTEHSGSLTCSIHTLVSSVSSTSFCGGREGSKRMDGHRERGRQIEGKRKVKKRERQIERNREKTGREKQT